MLDKNMNNKAHLTSGEPDETAVFIVEARIPELEQPDSSLEKTSQQRWQIPERHREEFAARRAITREKASLRKARGEEPRSHIASMLKPDKEVRHGNHL